MLAADLQQGSLLSFFTLPTDLLPFIFFFLSPKELCCLDSAILNHKDRPLFLSALIQRFQNDSIFGKSNSLKYMTRWYLCRRIPITALLVPRVVRPKDMLSMNSNYLKEVCVTEVSLNNEDLIALGQCLNLKKLAFDECSCPPNFNISSILRNLSSLEDLNLRCVPFSRADIEILCQSCPLLTDLKLLSLHDVGDEKLRLLLEGLPALRSLALMELAITDESVRMLLNHRPRIPSIGIAYCESVSSENVLSLLSEIIIPTILISDGDEELFISAIENLTSSISYFDDQENPDFNRLLAHTSLLNRLVSLVTCCSHAVRPKILILFHLIVAIGYPRRVVAAGVVPILVRLFNSLNEDEKHTSLSVVEALALTHPRHVLTSGVLSMFRARHLRVKLPQLLLTSYFLFS
jgi:hypothetical protein